jgi:hypothetical protein
MPETTARVERGPKAEALVKSFADDFLRETQTFHEFVIEGFGAVKVMITGISFRPGRVMLCLEGSFAVRTESGSGRFHRVVMEYDVLKQGGTAAVAPFTN